MEWISVDRVMPENLKDVLIWIPSDGLSCGNCLVAHLDDYSSTEEKNCYRGWFTDEREKYGENRLKKDQGQITHWMPLPDHPNS
jgi:hypothetical protein